MLLAQAVAVQVIWPAVSGLTGVPCGKPLAVHSEELYSLLCSKFLIDGFVGLSSSIFFSSIFSDICVLITCEFLDFGHIFII